MPGTIYIPSKQLTKHTIKGLLVEINLRKANCLLYGTNHPPSQNKSLYFNSVSSALDTYLVWYDESG